MTACKQTASMGAAATDEADSKSAAKGDGVEERKPSTKCRKGKKAKGKLAVKSNGAEKLKTRDLLSDVTGWLAVTSIAEEKTSKDEKLALFIYQEVFWMENFEGVYDKPSVDAIRKIATEKWKFFSDSEKAPYFARARVNKILITEVHEAVKTMKLAREMMNLKM